MKINTIIIAAILIVGAAGAGFSETQAKDHDRLILKYGVDTNGLQNYPSTISSTFPLIGAASFNVDLGTSFSAEIQHPVSDMLGIGLGATYNMNRNISGQTGQFSFLPVYATVSVFPLGNIAGLAPYAKADLGYTVAFTGNDAYKAPAPFTTTLYGGVYWGLGAGIKLIDTIYVDLMFTSYSGTYRVALNPLSTDFPILYTKVSLTAGMGFNL